MEAYAVEIIGKVKTAARARVRSIAASARRAGRRDAAHSLDFGPPSRSSHRCFDRRYRGYPRGALSPAGGCPKYRDYAAHSKAFSGPFAERMNSCSALTVCEAQMGS